MSVTPSAGNVNLQIKAPASFINGLNVAWVSTTTLTVSTGSCVDSTGVSNMFLDTGVTFNAATVGLNGMDVGTLANSTDYYMHLVGNSVNKKAVYQGVVLSLSSTAPTLPTGFDTSRLIDYLKTNGSAQLYKFYNNGNAERRVKMWDAPFSVLAAGAATTLTPFSLAPALPPGIDNMPVVLSTSHTPNAAGGKVSILPFGSTSSSTAPAVSGSVAAVAQIGEISTIATLNAGVPTLLYINSAATGASTVYVTSFTYNL